MGQKKKRRPHNRPGGASFWPRVSGIVLKRWEREGLGYSGKKNKERERETERGTALGGYLGYDKNKPAGAISGCGW